MSFFGRLKAGLGKTASRLTETITSVVKKKKLDQDTLDDLFDALLMADLGMEATEKLIKDLKSKRFDTEVSPEEIKETLAEGVAEILGPIAVPLQPNAAHRPFVVLMVGVNGSGKTTTAGKLAELWQSEGKTVMMAAADTFRAAAIDQLKIWGERTGCEVIHGEPGGDVAAIAYQGLEKAIAQNADILIIDTAGRLQARQELMDELAKIRRVLEKKGVDAPHASILVLDGTVGQNAISQVKAFNEATPLSGLIVTKLDGSARGGIVVALAEQFGLPVHAVGVGETKEDLKPFEALDFGKALVGLSEHSD